MLITAKRGGQMTLADELKTIADTVALNGGWRIAALKIHQAIERIAHLEEALAECQKVRDEWCAEYTKLRGSAAETKENWVHAADGPCQVCRPRFTSDRGEKP
jgi:hypothetical protein